MRTTSYSALKFSPVRRIIANIDKTSAFNESKRVHSPWGIIRHYGTRILKNGKHQRIFAVSDSKVLHNGGNYTFRKVCDALRAVGK